MKENMNNNQDTQAQDDQAQFAIQRVYVKDVSFESPNAPAIFLENDQPDINMDLNIESANLENNFYDVTLTVTVNAKVKDKTLFLVEVKQSGIFLLEGIPADQNEHLLNIVCPQMLFPYAAEVVSNLTQKGSLPPLTLQPVNFEALYLHNQQANGQES